MLIRAANSSDFGKIFLLYKKVAAETIGLARVADEITKEYIQHLIMHSAETGIQLVIDHPANANQIIAEIHCYKLFPKVFNHILSELTIAVDPNFQGRGLGKVIFSQLLKIISDSRPEIMRVELIARESNIKAISFYESLGFKQEGRFEKRIRNDNNQFEADIPMAWFNPTFSMQ